MKAEHSRSEEGRGVVKREEENPYRKDESMVHKHEGPRNPVRVKVEVDEDRSDRPKERVKEPQRPSPLRTVRRKDVCSSSSSKAKVGVVRDTRISLPWVPSAKRERRVERGARARAQSSRTWRGAARRCTWPAP